MRLQLKNLHELFEYWCFLHIVQFLRKELTLKNQTMIGLDADGIVVRLARGKRSELIFAGEDGREVSLLYNPSFPWPDFRLSGGQKPDIVLQFWQRNDKERRHIATYIFDAKYRIETNGEYLTRYGCPGPPESAINQMHRYRDALFEHFAESGSFERVAYGAYVLFPFHDERSFSDSRFFRSVHTINVGAFPALPGHTALLDDFLLLLLKRSGLFHDCAVTPLRLASWEYFRNESRHLVLIIRVPPADRDMQWISSQRLCYIDAMTGNLRPSGARFIAFYEPENRYIRYYAGVSGVTLVERSAIHTLWHSRRQDDHQCWLFSINPVEPLPNPIIGHMDRTSWRYANLYSLLHARSMEELALTTEQERLIKEALDNHNVTYKVKINRWDIRDDGAQASPEFHFVNSRGLQCIIRSRKDGVPMMIVNTRNNRTTESALSQRDIVHGGFL
ncbi:MAG: nuclease domain-containing protein [Candidatus Xenobiia bacterium LiM19]